MNIDSRMVLIGLVLSLPLSPTTSLAQVTQDDPIGWASVSGLGQDGTTGGAGGEVVTATNESELKEACKRREPCVVLIRGTFHANVNLIRSNKSLIGIGSDAGVIGGLRVDPAGDERKNIVIRNLTIRDAGGDGIAIEDGAHHIWIDHCDISNCGDGAVDITHGCDFITVSWNKFHDHDKTLLLGHSDTNGEQDKGRLTVTYHHNWFQGTGQRHPRVRHSRLTHVFNNFYDGVGSYGIGSSEEAALLVENNFFRTVPQPFLSGSGVGESAPGYLRERGNIFEDCGATREQHHPELVPEARDFYDYQLDPAPRVPGIIAEGAGVGRLPPVPTEEDVPVTRPPSN